MNMEKQEQSPVLVFGVGGRVGSGASFVVEQLKHTLFSYNYQVYYIDISTLIILLDYFKKKQELKEEATPDGVLEDLETAFKKEYPEKTKRTEKLQELGNDLRKRYQANHILASAATVFFISNDLENEESLRSRKAYLIDSLKHPAEVQFLRETFRDAFYMIGVVSSDERRFNRLEQRKGYSRADFERISKKDADEDLDYGQKAIKTVLKSDYIIPNDYYTKDDIRFETERLMSLIFGSTIITPRNDEFCMNIASKAAAKSGCLSRQVGAAIFSEEEHLISTGYNDVPQFNGGLYNANSPEDERCWTRAGRCYNDREKGEIADKIKMDLLESGLVKEESKELVREIIFSSQLRELIEFSRAVHAEMDAIINVARNASQGIVGSTLYCTAYPCHNCAKHIVDAGIRRVVYLEPYQKSLAIKLHSDTINDSSQKQGQKKVDFVSYGGVEPSRYEDFFRISRERKTGETGQYIDYGKERQDLLPISPPLVEDLSRILKRTSDIIKPKFQ
jgi:deoxycytidylate deaminase